MTSTTSAPPRPPGSPIKTRTGSAAGVLALLFAVAAVGVLSLMVGSRTIAPGTVLDVLFDPNGGEVSGIVHGLRVPRTVLTLLVGLSLGVAGALMQGYTRNPLADPGLLGITAGASFAVVLGIFAFGITGVFGYTWMALIGAGLGAAAVFGLGSSRGGPSPLTLVLAGSAISALLGALTTTIVVRDANTLDEYRFWVVGSASGRGLDVAAQVAPFMALGLLLGACCIPALNLLQLGEDVASALGLHTTRGKVVGITAVMLLTGAATAACGPTAFVGLVVPHAARFFAGVDYRWLVPYAGLFGALLVTLADIAGRVLARPGELQVGIVMALIGGPVFVALVRRSRMVRL